MQQTTKSRLGASAELPDGRNQNPVIQDEHNAIIPAARSGCQLNSERREAYRAVVCAMDAALALLDELGREAEQ